MIALYKVDKFAQSGHPVSGLQYQGPMWAILKKLIRSPWDRCYDFFNILAEKFCEKMAFLTRNKAKLCKNLVITLVFEKNANFFAENCQKSPKIVIITSVPVCIVITHYSNFTLGNKPIKRINTQWSINCLFLLCGYIHTYLGSVIHKYDRVIAIFLWFSVEKIMYLGIP
jgi:uncharacterized membrane protein YhaH (DUF805 family)